MATYYESANVKGSRPSIALHSAGEVGVSFGKYTAVATPVIGDLYGLAILPAGCMPVDFTLGSGDFDSCATPLITMTVGILNDDEDDLVALSNFMTAETIGQGGGLARADVATFLSSIAVDNANDRVIAVKLAAGPATGALGTVYGTLLFRPAEYGE